MSKVIRGYSGFAYFALWLFQKTCATLPANQMQITTWSPRFPALWAVVITLALFSRHSIEKRSLLKIWIGRHNSYWKKLIYKNLMKWKESLLFRERMNWCLKVPNEQIIFDEHFGVKFDCKTWNSKAKYLPQILLWVRW